jgi:hypothetical protein
MALLCSLPWSGPEAASTNCAMMVAHDKMLAGDLKALDRTLKVIESQDR